jgi:hypothetical protein
MPQPIRILLQTTIPPTDDDWGIVRFSMLRDYLSALTNAHGDPLCYIIARDREVDSSGSDRQLSKLAQTNFDQLWLFAVDTGDGLTEQDCEGINAFRQRGGGILAARDHQDLGSSLCKLSGVCHGIGLAHYFHSLNPDPDPTRHCADDRDTSSISWPNYHSGRNGDYQQIIPVKPIHALLHNPASAKGIIEYFPAHPHEGGVGVPIGEATAQVVAMGTSRVSDRTFNLAVAFDSPQDGWDNRLGRAVVASTFHHFCDYNWNPEMGCPSFVTESPGNGMVVEPQALSDVHTYIRNIVYWLSLR